MMAAEVSGVAGELHVGSPKRLFEPPVKLAPLGWPYDVAPNGRFLINIDTESAAPAPIRLVVNWQTLLAPVTGRLASDSEWWCQVLRGMA